MPEKRVAVVVGASIYKDPKLNPLPGSFNDAIEIHKLLTEDAKNPDFVYDAPPPLTGLNANCANIRAALSKYFWKTDEKADLAVFYFSGHGREDQLYGDGYIAPYDMSVDDPFVNGIKMSELREIIRRSAHTCCVTILDCCFSGLILAGSKGGSEVKVSFRERAEEFADVGKGRIIMASSSEDEKSWQVQKPHFGQIDTHEHGAFTYNIIEGVNQGNSTFKNLIEYLENKSQTAEQSCCSSLSGTRLQNTVIVRQPSEKHEELLGTFREQTKNHLEKGHSILAVRCTSEMLRIDPRNKDAAVFKNECISALKADLGKACEWLDSHLGSGLYPNELYDRMAGLVRTDFDGILKLKDDDNLLLTSLCMICKGTMKPEWFRNMMLGIQKRVDLQAGAQGAQGSSVGLSGVPR